MAYGNREQASQFPSERPPLSAEGWLGNMNQEKLSEYFDTAVELVIAVQHAIQANGLGSTRELSRYLANLDDKEIIKQNSTLLLLYIKGAVLLFPKFSRMVEQPARYAEVLSQWEEISEKAASMTNPEDRNAYLIRAFYVF
jgi:hypothetical protein